MIFTIVGTQEPFDRLIQYLDEWTEKTGYKDLIAQVSSSGYKPKNFEYFDFIPTNDFNNILMEADLIVSHAGMGSIISALQYHKPIIVMPRLASLKEHRNDHQLATANSFAKLGYVKAVYSKEDLFLALENRSAILPGPHIGSEASQDLIDALEEFIYKKK